MGKLLGLYVYITDRLKEPSTHAAISSLLLAAGLNLDVGPIHNYLVAASVLFGGLGFFVKESGPETKV